MCVPMPYAGLLVGAALVVIAIALTLGAGMLAWRLWWDSELGHAWLDDWRQTLERWRR